MQLRDLRLRNLRSYPDARLALSPGTTLITGDVGSGKTSLLYAIEMALFGFAEVDPAYLVRHQASEAEVALVLEDGAERYEILRRFRRVVTRGREGFRPVDSVVTHNGQRVRYSPTELRQRAIDLLGFPDNPNPTAHSDLWRWAVFVPQEQMREVLQGDAQLRLETVRKALSLEQYRTAADNAQLLAREFGRRSEDLNGRAELVRAQGDSIDSWRELHEERRRELSDVSAQSEEEAALLESLDESLRGLDRQLEARGAERRESERLESERTQLLDSLRHAEAESMARARVLTGLIEQAATSEPTIATREELARQSDAGIAERGRIADEVTRAELDLRQLAAARAEARAAEESETSARRELAVAEIEWSGDAQAFEAENATGPRHEPPSPTSRSLEAIDRELAEIQRAVDAHRVTAARLTKERDDFDAMRRDGRCPVCLQAVSEATVRSHAAHAEELLPVEQESLRRAEQRISAAQQERKARERYERNLSEFQASERRRADLSDRVARSRGRVDQLTAKALDATEARAGAERRVARFAVAEARMEDAIARRTQADLRRSELERQARENERRLERAQEAVELLPNAQAELERSRGDATRLRDLEAGLEQRRQDLEKSLAGVPALESRYRAAILDRTTRSEAHRATNERLGRLKAELAESSRRIAEAEQARTRRDRLLAERDHARALGSWLAGPFRESLQTLEHRLLARARDEFDRLLARYFATLIEDPSLIARLDASFSPEVEIDGQWTPAEALSGGERTALALAYRLALGQLVRSAGRLRLETLVLDEPTDGFSPEQVQRVGELLEELKIPQVLLVSHEAGLASVADHVVRVVKVGGRSRLEGSGVFARGTETGAPEGDRSPELRPTRLDAIQPPPVG